MSELRIAVQMDSLAHVNIHSDTTFALMLAAQQRGHYLTTYHPSSLSLSEGRVRARLSEVSLSPTEGDHFTQSSLGMMPLDEFDVVLMRQDPPFNMAYITATHLLEMLPAETYVCNDPVGVRNAPEKLSALEFYDLMPPTIVSAESEVVSEFLNEHREIVIKPLHGSGGRGVFRLNRDDSNLDSTLEALLALDGCPAMAQPYLASVSEGDKRIILLDGEPVGAINRVPRAGQTRANLRAGATPQYTELTERDQEICRRLAPRLREDGLFFVGIDVIGEYLTEINVTSPTGVQEIKRLSDIDIPEMFWQSLEAEVDAASA